MSRRGVVRSLLTLGYVVAGLAACAQAEFQTNRDAADPLAPQPSATSRVEPPAKTGGAVIIFSRSGGFAGISEEWSFYGDGRVVSIDGAEDALTPEQVTKLLEDIEELGFFEWEVPRALIPGCADCFTYRITMSVEGETGHVDVIDGAAEAPEELWEAIRRIQGVIDNLSQ